MNPTLKLHLLTSLQRNFNLLSTLGFISIYMSTWEFARVRQLSEPDILLKTQLTGAS